jgi:signal transduction histidine kinase
MSTSNLPKSSSKRNAWEHWVKIWHIVFYLTLVLPTTLALLSGDLGQSPELVLGLSLALGIWYALVMIWIVPRTDGYRQWAWSLIFLVGGLVLWIPLARAYPAYYLIASSFYGLMWGTLPFGLAVAGNVILTGLIIWLQALSLDRPVIFSVNLLVIGAIVIGWSVLLALWVRTIMKESAERKRLIEQLEAAQEELAAVERQAGILEERQRMAGEIHDTLAQGFTSIVMQLEAADQAVPEDMTTAENHIRKARETARASLREARRLVLALQPEPLEESSLAEALRREAEHWTLDFGIKTNYSVTGDPISLHPQIEVTLLRAMQEGLANVQKHAEAQEFISPYLTWLTRWR